jgi:hypothetical protein
MAELAERVTASLQQLGSRHRLVTVGLSGLRTVLAASPIPLSSMGRGLEDDPAYFLAAAVGGRHAAMLLDAEAEAVG